jgi:hypothetical protein
MSKAKKRENPLAVKGTFDDLIKASVSGNPAPKPKPIKPKKTKTKSR